MAHILIIYHSQTGHTRRMAEAVAAGAASIENSQVVLKAAAEAGIEDLAACDGLVIGSPEYFGYMAGMIKDFFDRTYETAHQQPNRFRKPYMLFISAGNDGRNARDQIERICVGFRFRKVYESLIARGELNGTVLEKCRDMGQTIAAGCDLGIY
jgi:multimeric flavodoxin WrbA